MGFGCAYLVNPVIALFPVALSLVFWREREAKFGITVLLVSLIAVAGWDMRNSVQSAAGDGRAWQNLVQGAWPGYHDPATWWPSTAAERETRASIEAEMDTIMEDHAAGLRRLGTRLAGDPGTYAAWYLLKKPYLLWEWDIRMGLGGIYTLGVLHSPLEHGILGRSTAALSMLNPILFVLAVGFAVVGFKQGGAASMAALFFLYITAVHVVFQAEPRYAIAYRPVEMILIAAALARLAGISRVLDTSPA